MYCSYMYNVHCNSTWKHLCSAPLTASTTLPFLTVKHFVKSLHHMIWETLITIYSIQYEHIHVI